MISLDHVTYLKDVNRYVISPLPVDDVDGCPKLVVVPPNNPPPAVLGLVVPNKEDPGVCAPKAVGVPKPPAAGALLPNAEPVSIDRRIKK